MPRKLPSCCCWQISKRQREEEETDASGDEVGCYELKEKTILKDRQNDNSGRFIQHFNNKVETDENNLAAADTSTSFSSNCMQEDERKIAQ
ncbi:hypothetical protein JTB14_024663 [Gonioctena quinquepunctata]|nr:hypothetical protein JTB14_024663 [Gonioctena quinquepunctata]